MEPWIPAAPERARRRWPLRRRRGEARPADPREREARVRRRIAEERVRADPGAAVPLGESVRAALTAEFAPAHGANGEAPAASPALAARVRALQEELEGFGPLAEWVGAPGVTDVLVDGAGTVWTDGAEGLRARPRRLAPEEAETLAVRLVGQGGRRLDAAVPLADARVQGVRVHAALPPVSAAGPVLSLRVPAPRTPSLAELAMGWPDGARWEAVVAGLVRHRATVLVSGATGTGKTTLLSAALSLVPHDERIVVVEDTREAAPDHPHVVPLQARAANAEGAGAVGLDALIRESLRMRPDRLVVGECRGAEVADLLTALNTGHQGAWGTLHANAAQDVPARLVAMGALAGWSPGAVAAQTRAGVDAVLHVRRDALGRRPVQLCVPDRPADPSAPLAMVPALTWEPPAAERHDGPGPASPGRTRLGPGMALLRARLAGRAPETP